MAKQRRDKSGANIHVPGKVERSVKERTLRMQDQEKRMEEKLAELDRVLKQNRT